jgi:hypothetical protein
VAVTAAGLSFIIPRSVSTKFYKVFLPRTLSNFISDVARHFLYAVTELLYTTTGVLRSTYLGIMVELRGISPIVL